MPAPIIVIGSAGLETPGLDNADVHAVQLCGHPLQEPLAQALDIHFYEERSIPISGDPRADDARDGHEFLIVAALDLAGMGEVDHVRLILPRRARRGL